MRKLNVELPELPYSVEEAMNRLRINIRFLDKDIRKILITSSLPNEGKSVVSVQLWKTLSEAGFKTVFVDADLRNSTLKKRHRYTAEDGGHIYGMSYYLSSQVEYEDIVYETNVENGYYVPCVHLIDNYSTLLEGKRFKELFERLAQDYRYVIIDTPPLGMVADSMMIASIVDGAILVVRGGDTSKRIIKDSLQQIENANCRLIGTVLNRVETNTKKYGKYGKYGSYGYGYGYGYGNYGKTKD